MTKKTNKQPKEQKDAIEVFLGVQRNRAGVDEWENYKEYVEQSPEHAAEQKSIETMWCDAGNLPNDMMPTAEELAADTYDGEETVDEYLCGKTKGSHKASLWSSLLISIQNSIGVSTLRPAFAGIAFLMVAAATVFLIQGNTPQQYATGVSEHRRITLDDGSLIMLGAKSEVSVDYQDNERSVALISGEAYFDVAKDTSRPFIVDVNGVQVQAVGTAFNILNGPEEVLVSVTEGIVRVDHGEADDLPSETVDDYRVAMLEVGDALNISKATFTFEQTEKDPSRMLFWQNDILYFRGEQLKDIVYRVDRYTEEKIILADAELGALLFSGSINRHNIDGWLNTLPLAFPVAVDRRSDRIIIAPKTS